MPSVYKYPNIEDKLKKFYGDKIIPEIEKANKYPPCFIKEN